MPSINVDFTTAFKNAGVDFNPLQSLGVVVAASTTGIKFAKDGEVLASLPIPPGKISELATKFDSANQTHQTMKASLSSVFGQLLTKLAVAPVPATVVVGKPVPFTASAPAAPLPEPAAANKFPTFPLDKMKSAVSVPLATATQLFQPVKGSSANSRYYVVGLGPDVRVAARHQGEKLSLRIEGPAMTKHADKIAAAGIFGPEFTGAFKSEYASMHVGGITSKVELQRVIGAVLSSLAPMIANAPADLLPILDVA